MSYPKLVVAQVERGRVAVVDRRCGGGKTRSRAVAGLVAVARVVIVARCAAGQRVMLLALRVRVVARAGVVVVEQPEGRVPPIVPVVLSHAEDGWRKPVTMRELYDAPEELLADLLPYLPDFRFVLDDVAARSDEELMARALQATGVLGLLLLRHTREERNMVAPLLDWVHLMRAVWEAPDGREAFRMVVRYVMLANKLTTIQDLVQALVPVLGPGAQEVIMTEGQRLIEQGRIEGEARGEARGVARGRAEGRATAVLAVLSARGLAISAAVRDRVMACTDVPTLDRWIVRAATAASAEDALSDG